MKQIDKDLWSCLGVFMEECNGLRGVSCGAMAITLRALHLLHSFILNSPILLCYRVPSEATLRSIFMISVDIAGSHGHVFNKVNVDSVPPSCGYISRAALRHLESLDTDLAEENDQYWRILARSVRFSDERWGVEKTV
ncbi:hypothetical protein SI65_09613 [Aspergillus cristatus]|uniref:Uncharacterized protein n=1 Tax=Aspergillus cristatus TaxID=573508 RepID=A0A1E3B204_ASPCR|nr:hypothetical protein SI65_09613 [Aspergillus cristatus]